MIITKDTTWRSGQTVTISDKVQVAHGVTLTIEPGAVVRGGSIEVFGTLQAEGTADKQITFDDVNLLFGSDHKTPGRFNIAYSTWTGGNSWMQLETEAMAHFVLQTVRFTAREGSTSGIRRVIVHL